MIHRREFLIATIACGPLAGCLRTRKNRLGVVDASDVSVTSTGSAEVTVSNAQKNNGNFGLAISTEDSMTDGKAIVEIPVSISNPSLSTIYMNADVGTLDDDTNVETRFQSGNFTHRSIYIGNEYKAKENGVLATEPGSGYQLQKPFEKLPSPDQEKTPQSDTLDSIRLVIGEGDFSGKIWALRFMLEDRTVAIL